MAGEEEMMDEQIIQELTDSVLNNEFVQNALDVYVPSKELVRTKTYRTMHGTGKSSRGSFRTTS